MDYKKLNKPTLKTLFVKEVEALILSGEMDIGQKLPSERELADRLQVSRAVVNNGITEMSRKGFLKVKPRSGVYVLDYRRYGSVEALLSIMNYNSSHLRRDVIRSILEIKLIVDRLATELAVQKLTDEDLMLLCARLNDLEKQRDNMEAASGAAFEFYHELSMISGNSLLPLIYRSFRAPGIQLWKRFLKKYGSSVALSSATAIYDALQARDKEAAVEAAVAAVAASVDGPLEIYED